MLSEGVLACAILMWFDRPDFCEKLAEQRVHPWLDPVLLEDLLVATDAVVPATLVAL